MSTWSRDIKTWFNDEIHVVLWKQLCNLDDRTLYNWYSQKKAYFLSWIIGVMMQQNTWPLIELKTATNIKITTLYCKHNESSKEKKTLILTMIPDLFYLFYGLSTISMK